MLRKNELCLVEGILPAVQPNKAVIVIQAILLFEEVLNESKWRRIRKNEEINTMIYTIGAGVRADFNVRRY